MSIEVYSAHLYLNSWESGLEFGVNHSLNVICKKTHWEISPLEAGILWQYAEIVQDSTEIHKGALSYSLQAVEMELSNTQ
jgi:hypothetical protein